MIKSIEATGKTENDAIAAALKKLGLDRDSVSVEVIARAKTGFLGIGSQPARIRVSYEVPDEPKPAAPVPEAAPAAAAEPVRESAPTEPVAPIQEAEEPAAPVQEAAQQSAPTDADGESAAPEQGEKAPRKRTRRRRKKPQTEQGQTRERVSVESAAAAESAAVEAVPAEPAPDRTEEIDRFLTGLMEKLEVEAKPVIRLKEENIYAVELVGENLGGLIGRRGDTLDAIQQLTNYAVNNGQTQRVRIHIDAENYRAKREESLQRLARKTAGKAIKYRRNMMLEPMNAYERHVIHAALQDFDPSISTYSTGTEPNRRIVVAYSR